MKTTADQSDLMPELNKYFEISKKILKPIQLNPFFAKPGVEAIAHLECHPCFHHPSSHYLIYTQEQIKTITRYFNTKSGRVEKETKKIQRNSVPKILQDWENSYKITKLGNTFNPVLDGIRFNHTVFSKTGVVKAIWLNPWPDKNPDCCRLLDAYFLLFNI